MTDKLLNIFKKSLLSKLDKDGFNSVDDIFNTILSTKDTYSYSIETFNDLRTRSMGQFDQLNSITYIVGLKVFINTIELSDTTNENQKHLYDNHLKYPNQLKQTLPKHFKDNKDKLSILLVQGKSSPLKPSSHRSMKRHHIWFVEHLLPSYLELAKTKHKYLKFWDNRLHNKGVQIVEDIALNLELIDDNIPDDEKAINDVLIKIGKDIEAKLMDGCVVLPFFISKNISLIEDFLNKYLNVIVENIDKTNLNHSFLVLLVIEDENETELGALAKTAKNVQIEAIDEEVCTQWVDDTAGFFFQNEDICTCFCDNYKKGEYIPECKTQEKLFEKITQDIFPDISFDEFLKNNFNRGIQ
jgi:hypothetical protein